MTEISTALDIARDGQTLIHGGEVWNVQSDGRVLILTVRCEEPTVTVRFDTEGSFRQHSVMEGGECLESTSWEDAEYSLSRTLDSALDMLGDWEDSAYEGDDYSHAYESYEGDDGGYYEGPDSDLWNEY
jgi:hypothetical protein